MAQLPDTVLFEFPNWKFCVSSLQVGSQVAGKMQLGQQKIGARSIKSLHQTCHLLDAFCILQFRCFLVYSVDLGKDAPRSKASSGPLSGLQKKLQELEGRLACCAKCRISQLNTSCGFGLVVWVFLITLYFDQRKPQKKLINLNLKNHQWK